jgi:glycosyltransferase involved in cell wall biosynthesis
MLNPLISIITPCFNSGKYIKDTIESVLYQTYTNFEWIIINDGSTDNTEEIVQSYKDERIRYIYQENRGQCTASNKGIEASIGNFIKFLDADDIMNLTHLQNLIDCIKDEETLISCSWGRFYNDDLSSFKLERENVSKSLGSIEWIKMALNQRHDMMPGWLWLIPRNIIRKSGGWDERFTLNNDFEFSIRLLLASKEVKFSQNAIIYYRTNKNTLSSTYNESSLKNAIQSNILGIKLILTRENSELTRRICANRLQEWAFITYPEFPNLFFILNSEIKKLGGSNIKIEGGIYFRLIVFFLGWKKAKKIKQIIKRSH